MSGFEEAMNHNCLLNNFISNIFLIGPKNVGKAYIFNALSHKNQISSFENTPATIFVNLDNLIENSNDSNTKINLSSLIDRSILSAITKYIDDLEVKENTAMEGLTSITTPNAGRRMAEKNANSGNDTNQSTIIINEKNRSLIDRNNKNHSENRNNKTTTTAIKDFNLTDAGAMSHFGLNVENNEAMIHNGITSSKASQWFSISDEYYQKYYNGHESQLGKHFAKIWNYDNYTYYQAFKNQHNLYIAPLSTDILMDENNKDIDQAHYIESLEEWIRNIFDWRGEEKFITVNIDGCNEEFSLPVVILVTVDSSNNFSKDKKRYCNFFEKLRKTMVFHKNCFCPDLIINCIPEEESNAAVILNESWKKFVDIIKAFITEFHNIDLQINISSYIAAKLLYGWNIINQSSQCISTIKEIMRITQNNMTKSQVVDGLKFLHRFGEVIIYEYDNLENSDSIVVTNIDLFVTVLQDFFDLNAHKRQYLVTNRTYNIYDLARNYGVISSDFIDNTSKGKLLTSKDRNNLLEALKLNGVSYHFARQLKDYKISNSKDYYFVPLLLSLHNKTRNSDSPNHFQSEWLYLGINQNERYRVTDHIFHQVLLCAQKDWIVELFHYGAHYRKKNAKYGINLKFIKNFIGIQYCYQKLRERLASDTGIDIKESNVTFKNSAIANLRIDQPHFELLKTLKEVVNKRYCSEQNLDCGFYILCSQCNNMVPTTEIKVNIQECYHCSDSIYSTAMNHWSFGNSIF